jgi:hypothetical protein
MTENPYQTPAVRDVSATVETDDEVIRKAHLKHEASVKAVGLLYLLGGVIGLMVLVAISIGLVVAVNGAGMGTQEILIFAIVGVVSGVQIAAGLCMRRLTGQGKILGIVLAAVGMIAFPVGTVIGAYILYLLLGSKGKMVFSPAYREVMARTPHLRYRSPLWIWILLGLGVILLVLMLFSTGPTD